MSNVIKSYRVGVCRSRPKAPVRWLTLDLASPEEGVDQVTLFFYETPPRETGFRNPETRRLFANLPVADFQPMYHVVQTEKPVYLHWRLDPENIVASIDLSTSDEAVGEGFVDGS
jgi:hypothetical protein